MRLDLVAENPLESLAAMSGMLPAAVVKVIWGFSMARTIAAAIELDILEPLAGRAMSAEELSAHFSYDPTGVETLLNALNSFRIVKRKNDKYELAAEGIKYLTSKSKNDLRDAIRLGEILERKLRHLPEAIRTGRRENFHTDLTEDEWSHYLRGLHALAQMTTKEVVRKIKLEKPKRLLDVGGGHGGFSAAFCKKHPELQAEVLDLPQAVVVGKALIQEQNVERVKFVEGDLRHVDWGTDHDVVLLFNILHNLEESDAERACKSAFDALKPGGAMVILEGEHGGGNGQLSFQEGFGELLFYVLSQSQTWPESTLRQWMQSAGFRTIKRHRLFTLPGAFLLHTVKDPAATR